MNLIICTANKHYLAIINEELTLIPRQACYDEFIKKNDQWLINMISDNEMEISRNTNPPSYLSIGPNNNLILGCKPAKFWLDQKNHPITHFGTCIGTTKMWCDFYDPIHPQLTLWPTKTRHKNQNWIFTSTQINSTTPLLKFEPSLLQAEPQHKQILSVKSSLPILVSNKLGNGSIMEEKIEKKTEGSFVGITYNIAFNNFAENIMEIIKFININDVAIVCLQEVTKYAYEIFKAQLAKKYVFYKGGQVDNYHDTMTIVSTRYRSESFNIVNASTEYRTIIITSFILNNRKKVTVANAHLLSKFFNHQYTLRKGLAIQQVCSEFQNMQDSIIKFMVGDFNFTGAGELSLENDIIYSTKCQFVDTWAELKFLSDTDCQEDQNDKNFQSRDATWNTIENQTPQILGHPYHEYHRPDRLIITKSLLSNVHNIEIIRKPWSDHYGLLFEITSP